MNWKRYVASMITPYLSGSVMEVGAGIGANVNFLNHPNITDWTLVEPDPAFFDLLNERKKNGDLPEKCKIFQGTLEELPAGQLANSIIYIDVLEHIHEHHQEIENAIAHLHPGGYLVILAPAHPSLYSDFDREIGHFRRYTPDQLKALFPCGRGEFVKACHIDHMGYFLSLVNRYIVKKSMPSYTSIRIWDRYLVPVSKKIDKLFHYRNGKSVILVWQMNNPI